MLEITQKIASNSNLFCVPIFSWKWQLSFSTQTWGHDDSTKILPSATTEEPKCQQKVHKDTEVSCSCTTGPPGKDKNEYLTMNSANESEHS